MRGVGVERRVRARVAIGLSALLVSIGLTACGKSDASPAATPTAAPPTTARPPTTVRAPTPHLMPTATPRPTFAVPIGTPIPADAVALRVNGHPITLRTYERQRVEYMRYLWDQGIDPRSARGRAIMLRADSSIQDNLIYQEIVRQYAAKHNLLASATEIQQKVRQDGGQATVTRKLASLHQTMDDYVADVTVINVFTKVLGSRTFRETEVHVRDIVLKSLADAQKIQKQLRAHADFSTLAGRNSIDSVSAARGGDLGYQTRAGLGPELSAVAFTLPLNAISQPVQVRGAYHIIQVLARVPNVPLSGQELGRARLLYWQRWYATQRKGAQIQVLVHSS